MNQKLKVVFDQIDAYNKRDIDTFHSFFSSDCLWDNGIGEKTFKNMDEMYQQMAAMFKRSPNLHCVVEKVIEVGDYIIFEEHVTGNVRPDGKEISFSCAAIYKVTNDKINALRILI